MKKIILSCKKATYLVSLREEGKLTFIRQLQLRAHLTVCSMCRLFEKQTRYIAENAGHTHEHTTISLSKVAKDNMKKAMNEISAGE